MENSRDFKKFKKGPLLIAIIFLAASSAAFFFLYKKINTNKLVAAETQSTWKVEATRREEIKTLNRSLKEIEEESAKLETHFAQSSDVVPFLDTIEGLGVLVSVKPEISLVDIAKDKSGLLVDMRSTGSFEGVYRFLLLLENSPYELEFLTVNIERQAGQDLSLPSQWVGNFKIKLLSFIP